MTDIDLNRLKDKDDRVKIVMELIARKAALRQELNQIEDILKICNAMTPTVYR